MGLVMTSPNIYQLYNYFCNYIFLKICSNATAKDSIAPVARRYTTSEL